MNCMYCGKDSSSSKNQEHIISAFLGGKSKLPLGYVCDECNNNFSKIELSVSREGLIGMMRSFEGPGKRGSISDSKKFIGNIGKTKDVYGRTNFIYMSKGKPYVINSISIEYYEFLKNERIHGHIKDEDTYNDFFNNLIKIDENNLKMEKRNYDIGDNEIIFYYDYPHANRQKIKNFNKKYYKVIYGKCIEQSEVKEVFSKLKNPKSSVRYNISENTQEKPIVDFSCTIDVKALDKFAIKTMLNTLAYFEGKEILDEDSFYKYKKHILNENSKNMYCHGTNNGICSVFKSKYIPQKMEFNHFCFYQYNHLLKKIFLVLNLYNCLEFGLYIPYCGELKCNENGIFVNFKEQIDYSYYDFILGNFKPEYPNL
ncbi:HNH endonuclease [Peptoniphilus genitalis]|uniref:HNH endonuclease n=1 Tax=Peptoniphilus genitalis TaxID=3036303 RepID=A0ABY4TK80_9FIRM|nr:HNH endonuclease [Peptoniphilus sp. SAHP1]URN40892.1 HNH endonuclease [Peptoniphilus sp. SAHP1]